MLGTAGAADPSGPVGRGRLRPGTDVTWFGCHVTAGNGGCPHTLVVTAQSGAGTLVVHVRQYADSGKGADAGGATVHAGTTSATTAADGTARIDIPAGRYSVWAEQPGRIRSFPVSAEVT